MMNSETVAPITAMLNPTGARNSVSFSARWMIGGCKTLWGMSLKNLFTTGAELLPRGQWLLELFRES